MNTDAIATFSHPKTIAEFESLYQEEYKRELAACDRWVLWCRSQNDNYGINFHQGMRAAHIFNNIKMGQLLRIIKKEPPNCEETK